LLCFALFLPLFPMTDKPYKPNSSLGILEHREFLYSAWKCDVPAIQNWIDKGVDINYQNSHGETALYLICGIKGTVDLVKLFLSKGADALIQTTSQQTCIHNAASCGNIEILKLFQEFGYKKINVEAWEGSSELIIATRSAQIETMKYLLEIGANVNCRDLKGSTPLFQAAKHGHVESTELLLANGADIKIPSFAEGDAGECVIHAALRFFSPKSN